MACGGVAIAMQPSINGRLAQRSGFRELVISFAVGALALLAVVLVAGRGSLRGSLLPLVGVTGGFLGAFFVTMTIVRGSEDRHHRGHGVGDTAQLTTGMPSTTAACFGFRQIRWTETGIRGFAAYGRRALVFRRYQVAQKQPSRRRPRKPPCAAWRCHASAGLSAGATIGLLLNNLLRDC